MKLRDMIETALFLAIGYVLHAIVPPILMGMKPDLLLAMLFLVILRRPSFRNALLAGAIAGIITAMTTSFPGGQVANIVDKLVTSLVTCAMVQLFGRVDRRITAGFVGVIGTVISGTIFLGTALVMVGLPGPFAALFTTVVLPAAALNTVALVIIYPIVAAIEARVRRAEPVAGAVR